MKRLLLLFILIPALSIAQTGDEELATYYYQNGEYEKALLYLEDIYKSKPTDAYFRYYLNSLKELERYEDAVSLMKKHTKKRKSGELLVELGALYEAMGEADKAEDSYQEALEGVNTSRGQNTKLADAFIRRDMLEYAEQVYEEARRLSNGYPYSYELASLYGNMGDHERMIEEYMDLIGYNRAYLRTVQNSLNRTFDFLSDDDPRVDILKTTLLKNVQKNPEQPVYYEMLTWLFTQRKEFDAAFIQAKAIDRRQTEDGQRLIALASLCTNNEAYDVAAQCYRHVVEEKGPGSRYYTTAQTLELVSAKKALTYAVIPEEEQVRELSSRMAATTASLPFGPDRGRLLREQAELHAYYLEDREMAITLLDSALRSPDMPAEFKAQCKLDLGDVLVAEGYVWDASLYFSQVEKDFKQDILGAEAKFRNARISYYDGDFEWAQAQLDVLKASTSKLISNDAMDLSLLITDNFNLDTITRPMELFAQADLLTFQNRLTEAEASLDALSREFPGHSLDDEVIYQRAKIAEKRGDFEGSALLLQEIVDLYYDDILADNALYELGLMHERVFKDDAKAQELYLKLFTDYPSSLYSADARKRFRRLRGDVLDESEDGIDGDIFRGIEN
jgi:tetratricopeptide (TPR) repeat protein